MKGYIKLIQTADNTSGGHYVKVQDITTVFGTNHGTETGLTVGKDKYYSRERIDDFIVRATDVINECGYNWSFESVGSITLANGNGPVVFSTSKIEPQASVNDEQVLIDLNKVLLAQNKQVFAKNAELSKLLEDSRAYVHTLECDKNLLNKRIEDLKYANTEGLKVLQDVCNKRDDLQKEWAVLKQRCENQAETIGNMQCGISSAQTALSGLIASTDAPTASQAGYTPFTVRPQYWQAP